MSIMAPDWMEDIPFSRPRYSLNPTNQADLAKTLLERQFAPEIATFLHAQFLAGNVSLNVETHGYDKDGGFEDDRGGCITGYDPATVHERASVKVHFKGAPQPISDQEMTDLRFPPGTAAARRHLRDVRRDQRTDRIKSVATESESGWL
jgi:hypothetical protein